MRGRTTGALKEGLEDTQRRVLATTHLVSDIESLSARVSFQALGKYRERNELDCSVGRNQRRVTANRRVKVGSGFSAIRGQFSQVREPSQARDHCEVTH